MSRWNPFARLENPKAVWAWGMYDLANQSFQLIINTLLYGVYIQKVVASDADTGKLFWAGLGSVSLLIVVLLSPIVGAIVDVRGGKVRLLVISGLIASALTACLALVGPGQLRMAAIIYIPAAILVGLGENILAAFLPQLANPKNMGFVSALGWTMSYIGAIVLQICVLVGIKVFGWETEAEWRPLFIFAGAWFALGVIPSILFLRDRSRAILIPSFKPPSMLDAGIMGVRRLAETVRSARRYRQLIRFLLAFFVYSLGTQTVVYFAAIIANDFKFNTEDLFLMALVLSVTAGGAAALLAKYQDRLGGHRTLVLVLMVWIITTLGITAMYWLHAPKWTFWIFASGIGIGFGGIGTASRAVVGCFTPDDKAAEFFGLWGMVYKGAGVIGPLVFAQASIALGAPWALLILSGFFLAGLILLRGVNEVEGVAAAHAARQGPETHP